MSAQLVGLATTSVNEQVAEMAAQVGNLSTSLATLTTQVTALAAGTATTVQFSTISASIVALTQRVAALEGKPDPCVALSGSLPIATLQIGTLDVSVPVPGLLPTDRIAVEVLADLPAGLVLGAVRPSPTTAGVLLVQTIASVLLTGKPALPLAITALR